MTKLPVFTSVFFVLATAALAGPPKKEPTAKAKVPTTIHCPVDTKDVVNIKEATAAKRFADYKGRRYYFCCADCPKAFKKNPEKYAKHESVPTPKAAK